MKVTLFTKKSLRHNYLIKLLSEFCNEVNVICEDISFDDRIKASDKYSKIKKEYFQLVNKAETKVFGSKLENFNNNNVYFKNLKKGEISNIEINKLKSYLNSDIYIVFGSSYIKGELIEYLIKKKTINIHMGLSPFYRGSDCNFWALFDNNPHLVGGTVQLISKGLDTGPIIYHALSDVKDDPFIYSMSTVKSTIVSLVEKIKNKTLKINEAILQDKKKEIRYTKKIEFTDKVILEFMKKNFFLDKKIDEKLYLNPHILKKI